MNLLQIKNRVREGLTESDMQRLSAVMGDNYNWNPAHDIIMMLLTHIQKLDARVKELESK